MNKIVRESLIACGIESLKDSVLNMHFDSKIFQRRLTQLGVDKDEAQLIYDESCEKTKKLIEESFNAEAFDKAFEDLGENDVFIQMSEELENLSLLCDMLELDKLDKSNVENDRNGVK